jgi:hypothetical protein
VACVTFIAIHRIEGCNAPICIVNLFQQKFIFAVGQRDISTARLCANSVSAYSSLKSRVPLMRLVPHCVRHIFCPELCFFVLFSLRGMQNQL